MESHALSPRVSRVYRLLKKTQPIQGEYDVAWWGPYYIERSREWHPSHFTLYKGKLYIQLSIAPHNHGISWDLATGLVEIDRNLSSRGSYGDGILWAKALDQLERRLKAARRDFPRYNRAVARLIPRSYRTGKIQRKLTWPGRENGVLPPGTLKRLVKSLREGARNRLDPRMTAARYLEAAGVAYDAGFKELRGLSPLEKYRRKADGRHGGLLDIAGRDANAFSRWFHGPSWSGTHPWEIVFGHPHGIMLSPRFQDSRDGWNFVLWVDSLGWYATTARMAIALGEQGIPFELSDQQGVLDALQGLDEVPVGPDLGEVRYETLELERPESLRHICWNPLPQLGAVTPEQAARISKSESAE